MKRIRKLFVHYFVPHRRNRYQPHFLRLEVAGVVAIGIVLLFLGSIAEQKLVLNGYSSQGAAVIASSLVDLANADRQQNGLQPLAENSLLQQAAQLKANNMAQDDYFAHTSPSGKDPWYWFEQAGYSFSYAGENLAVYFSDSDAVNTAWMNSPEHRANLLDPKYTQIGIATAYGLYQGVETTFVVQEFGTPAEVAAQEPAQQTTSPVVSSSATPPAGKPTVAAASTTPAEPTPQITVIAQDAGGISVKNENVPVILTPAASASTPASSNAFQAFVLKFIASPQSDLVVAYEIIGAIVALALMLEIGVEIHRQHPHRIALGISLIALMMILVYADHSLLSGSVVIG